MVRQLCAHAIRRGAMKRGGQAQRVELEDPELVSDVVGQCACREALEAFDGLSMRQRHAMRLRAHGLSHQAIGELEEVSEATIRRELKDARDGLRPYLGERHEGR
eukprot:TRINITY_DN16449_c0_g2_i2.p4 TRINITY_DN16449_c0_g2~~TRINITY_DN16449_c0_g2_i2.p4  ORF type:complete len:105 (-),score=12.62 TRINITY_DN16449_c0_g2_i2:197-511(-)